MREEKVFAKPDGLILRKEFLRGLAAGLGRSEISPQFLPLVTHKGKGQCHRYCYIFVFYMTTFIIMGSEAMFYGHKTWPNVIIA